MLAVWGQIGRMQHSSGSGQTAMRMRNRCVRIVGLPSFYFGIEYSSADLCFSTIEDFTIEIQ